MHYAPFNLQKPTAQEALRESRALAKKSLEEKRLFRSKGSDNKYYLLEDYKVSRPRLDHTKSSVLSNKNSSRLPLKPTYTGAFYGSDPQVSKEGIKLILKRAEVSFNLETLIYSTKNLSVILNYFSNVNWINYACIIMNCLKPLVSLIE